MSTASKIVIATDAVCAAALAGFLLATTKGNEIRRQYMDKWFACKKSCCKTQEKA